MRGTLKRLAKSLPGISGVIQQRDELIRQRVKLRQQVSDLRRSVRELRQGRTDDVVSEFHQLYYDSQVWTQTYWRGTRILKCPLDLWAYQEILHDIRPRVIVETGTRFGGSAYYLASLCDLLDVGRIISIDIDAEESRPQHPRITYWTGSSTDVSTLERVAEFIGDESPVLVILDSDHTCDHVRNELRAYSKFVTAGSYLVVEDTNVNGHPVFKDFGPGPMEALEEFLVDSTDFEIDSERQKFLMTFNPRGYLRRMMGRQSM